MCGVVFKLLHPPGRGVAGQQVMEFIPFIRGGAAVRRCFPQNIAVRIIVITVSALAVRHGGAAVTIVQRGVVIALRPGDGHAPALCIVGETAPRLVVIGPADDPVRSVVLIKQVVVQPRIRFCQPPPRILFVGRQRLYAVIRAVNGFQVAAGMVRQFKPDPVGVTDTRDPVLAVALKRDAVAGGVAHPAQHVHPVIGAVCQAVIAGIVSHRVAQTHSRKGVIKEAAAQCIPVEQLQIIIAAAQNVLGVIRVNRRITVTVEGKSQRGSLGDDIHPVSLFTHPGVFAPGVAPAHAGQAMQRQYRTVETGEGEGEGLAQGEVGTFVAVCAGYRIDRICYPSDDFIGNTF